MNKKEIKSTVERYNNMLEGFGVGEEALGWGKKGRSNLRFEILLSQWNFKDATVLDFGCGFGDLCGYMMKKRIAYSHYIGTDINANLIHEAKMRKYPNSTFLVQGSAMAQSKRKVDYVLSSGVFNFKLKDNSRFIRKSFAQLDRLSKKGFAMNFISDKVDFKTTHNHYSNPGQILELAYQYSNNLVLRNDYMPFEFTLFVNKSSKINEKLNVYKEYENYV
jgi:SAM-dependent methyltransferase